MQRELRRNFYFFPPLPYARSTATRTRLSSVETLESPRHEGRHLGPGWEREGGRGGLAGGDNREEASNLV